MWKAVKAQVETQLREHKDYKLVLTGAYAVLTSCQKGDSCLVPFVSRQAPKSRRLSLTVCTAVEVADNERRVRGEKKLHRYFCF